MRMKPTCHLCLAQIVFFCQKGAKSVNKIVLDNDKKNYTVQTCCNARGEFLSHYILFKGLHRQNVLFFE